MPVYVPAARRGPAPFNIPNRAGTARSKEANEMSRLLRVQVAEHRSETQCSEGAERLLCCYLQLRAGKLDVQAPRPAGDPSEK